MRSRDCVFFPSGASGEKHDPSASGLAIWPYTQHLMKNVPLLYADPRAHEEQ